MWHNHCTRGMSSPTFCRRKLIQLIRQMPCPSHSGANTTHHGSRTLSSSCTYSSRLCQQSHNAMRWSKSAYEYLHQQQNEEYDVRPITCCGVHAIVPGLQAELQWRQDQIAQMFWQLLFADRRLVIVRLPALGRGWIA